MAKSRSRNQSGAAASRGATSARSRKSSAPAEIEVVEESRGMGIDDGIIIITTVILLTAALVIDYVAATNYGEGTLF